MENQTSPVDVCQCNRVRIGNAWVECENVLNQLIAQGVPINTVKCEHEPTIVQVFKQRRIERLSSG